MERKANKGCVLASLGNLLLPEANEETNFNIVGCVNSQSFCYEDEECADGIKTWKACKAPILLI